MMLFGRNNLLSIEIRRLSGKLVGSPEGIRTPVAAVRGRCPGPLDDGASI
jgi:hypothetical protein